MQFPCIYSNATLQSLQKLLRDEGCNQSVQKQVRRIRQTSKFDLSSTEVLKNSRDETNNYFYGCNANKLQYFTVNKTRGCNSVYIDSTINCNCALPLWLEATTNSSWFLTKQMMLLLQLYFSFFHLFHYSRFDWESFMLRLELKVFIGQQTKNLFCCHRCFNWFYLILDRLFEKCSRFLSVFLNYPDVMCLPKTKLCQSGCCWLQ